MDDLVQRGIAAVKVGDKLRARRLLGRAVQADSRNEQAWLWLSAAVETDEERLTCLEYVLMIDPDNAYAQRGAAALREKLGDQATTAGPVIAGGATELDHSRDLASLSKDELEALESFTQLVEYELTDGRKSEQTMVERLVKRGFPRRAVEEFVAQIASEILPQSKKRFGIRKLFGA